MENVVALSRPAAPSAPGQTPTIEIRLNPVRLICWFPVTVCVCPATTTVAEPAQVPANRSAYSAPSVGCCSCVESLLPPQAFIIAASTTAAANVDLVIVFPSPLNEEIRSLPYHGIRFNPEWRRQLAPGWGPPLVAGNEPRSAALWIRSRAPDQATPRSRRRP